MLNSLMKNIFEEEKKFDNRVCAGDVIKFSNPKLKSH